MISQCKLDRNLIWLIPAVIIFFFIYSFFSFNQIKQDIAHDLIFNSPDETANYYFAYLFAKDSRLNFTDPANEIVDDLVVPRSMRVINKTTVPASFIGFPLIAGTLAKFLGVKLILFVTTIFACLAVIFFYLLIKKVFNQQIAFIASLLLLINPAWWYYNLRTLMPNVLFISLLIISFYFFVSLMKHKRSWVYLLFGFFTGLMLMVRTSEITWLLPLFLILLIINHQRLNWKKLLLSLIVFIITFSPVFYFNYQNYQSIFSFGYAVDLDLQGKDILTQGLNVFEKIFLPFGFHPKLALTNFINYTFKIFPLWSLFVLVTFLTYALLVFWKKDKLRIVYLFLFLLVSFYLVIYYGSWNFHDNPDPEAITIGNSYVRYWLPLYIFVLPLIGSFFEQIFGKLKNISLLIFLFLFIGLGFLSVSHVYFGPDEGAYFIFDNLENYRFIQREVNKKIEDNAIIIADRLDKVFFPRHSVIFQLKNDYDYQRIYRLIENGYALYYFYFTRNESQLKDFNQRHYQPHNLEVQPSVLEFKKQSLYPITF